MTRYILPNSITAISLLLGLASIVTGHVGQLELAGWMIVWCGLLDVLDGMVARLLKATSHFGAEFDSMADLIAFGVAPALLVLHAGVSVGRIEPASRAFWVLLAAVGIFVLAGAMRLARFNLGSGQPRTEWFVGIPITVAGGGLISTAVILLIRYEEIAVSLPLNVYLPAGMLVLALGMISTIRYPKLVRRESHFINALQLFVVVSTYYCGITTSYPEYLFSMGLILLVAGIVAGRITKAA